MTARFIVFEGGEGSGKSTQAGRLACRLGAVLTREPGGTDVGVQLREVLLAVAEYDVALTDRSEALLMAADRAQHVATVVRPALAAGRHVVSDRYIPSTIAYQGAGRGLDAGDLSRLNRWATDGLTPDLVVLLEVPEPVAAERTGGARDRIEAAGADFHRRVAASFAEQAAAAPELWVRIDGDGDADLVEERVLWAVTDRWPELGPVPGAGQ